MTEPTSKSRQLAEIAFAEARSQFLARDPSTLDIDLVKQAHEEKTMRLRKARLARDAEDKTNMSDLIPRQSKKKA